jgi:5-methylcytosine-specific restriction protein A
MPLRPCLEAGCGQLTRATRCPAHQAQAQRAKDQRRPDRRTHTEQTRRRQAVTAHVATFGWWCPGGPGHPAHPSRDLTAQHTGDVALGNPESGPLTVLCRSENSRLGATVRRNP